MKDSTEQRKPDLREDPFHLFYWMDQIQVPLVILNDWIRHRSRRPTDGEMAAFKDGYHAALKTHRCNEDEAK